MKTIGIISEYNPFHNGHKYHIQRSKEICNSDLCISIMSGSFLQRGEPSIFDKWLRTEAALLNGADLVLEIPVIYSCQPAELFSLGSIKILDSLNIVDYLCFGSESSDIDSLKIIASILLSEPKDFKSFLFTNLSSGMSYPRAVSSALDSFLNKNSISINSSLLQYPNDVLGIEYIKAINKLKSNIIPIAIKRIKSNHNDSEILDNISSATSIRKEIKNNGLTHLSKQTLPENSYELIEKNIQDQKGPVFLDNFSDILLYKLRSCNSSELIEYINSNEGIENRVKKYSNICTNIDELIMNIKTKRYTHTYIQRLLCHILLSLNKKQVNILTDTKSPAYIRVLGFNDKGKYILKKIKTISKYPIITKVADFKSNDDSINKMLNYDINSTDIYCLGYKSNKYKRGGLDYIVSPVY